MRRREIGIQVKSSERHTNRVVVLSLPIQDHAFVDLEKRRKRIQSLRDFNLVQRFLEPAAASQKDSVPLMRSRVIGPDRNRLLVVLFRLLSVLVKGGLDAT